MSAELPVSGPGSEAIIYPDILETTARLNANTLVITASASACTEFARVWWTWSGDKVFSEVTQEPWASVPMTAGGGGMWTSPAISVPPGTVIGCFVEVGNSVTVNGVEHSRTHAAPIRLLRPTAAKPCEAAPTPYCYPSIQLRLRRHLHPTR